MPPIFVAAGDVLATKVGLVGSHNAFVDFGVYDYRQQNEASGSPEYRTAHPDGAELAFHAVCWLSGWLPPADDAVVAALPPGDGESGSVSDYCGQRQPLVDVLSARRRAPADAGRALVSVEARRRCGHYGEWMVRDVDLESVETKHHLYTQRLANTRRVMMANDVPVMLVRDPFNVLYATGARNMTVFNLCVPARYLLLFAEGPVILFDYVGGEHLATDLPTIDEVRTARGLSHVSSNGFTADECSSMAREIAAIVREHLGEVASLAVDSFPFVAVDALRAAGFTIADADALMSGVRRVKLPIEIAYLREAARRTVAAVRRMQDALRPGMTEVELWSHFVGGLIAGHGELVATRLLESGSNTYPYFQECGTRVIQDGDLVCIDTDAVAFESYQADFSRTFLAGNGPATAEQRTLYQRAHEQLRHNASLIGPGVTFEEVARNAWPMPDEHRSSRYYCVGHGIGMIGEYPNLPFHTPGVPYPLDDAFEPGMVFCVESYIGTPVSGQGVKLEDQLLVTDTGVEVLNDYPFEERLLSQ